jgi:hypothetical protein
MNVWQVDFYKRPFKDERGEFVWELVVCNPERKFVYEAKCPQSQANLAWLVDRLQHAAAGELPQEIQVFRPQSLSLLTAAGEKLGIEVIPTRRTPDLKAELLKRASEYNISGQAYNPIELEQPPPQPLPENLWGEEWRFASLPAGELVEMFHDRPIPILDMPESFWPVNLGVASNILIPGLIIYGGRRSMQLARWLQEARPVSVNYIITEVGKSGGVVLEAGLVDRWILATFEDSEVALSAQTFQQRKQASSGLHFLLVQPDDSGMTFSGFWLLLEF